MRSDRNPGPFGSASFGGVMTVAVPSGPGGQTHPCVSHGIYLVDDGGTRLVMVLQPVSRGPNPEVVLQITGVDRDRIQAILGEIRTLASERSVFRGQVISIGSDVSGLGPKEVFGPGRPVLAARPGRVDLAAELPLPDADARRQLIRLYQGSLVLDLARPEAVIERTEGPSGPRPPGRRRGRRGGRTLTRRCPVTPRRWPPPGRAW
jgi:hypothetical protein